MSTPEKFTDQIDQPLEFVGDRRLDAIEETPEHTLLELDNFGSQNIYRQLDARVIDLCPYGRLNGSEGALYAWATERHDDFNSILNGSSDRVPIGIYERMHLYLRAAETHEWELMAAMRTTIAEVDRELDDVAIIRFRSKLASFGNDRYGNTHVAEQILENSLEIDPSDHRDAILDLAEQVAAAGNVTVAVRIMVDKLGISTDQAQFFAMSAIEAARVVDGNQQRVVNEKEFDDVLDVIDPEKMGLLHTRRKRSSTLVQAVYTTEGENSDESFIPNDLSVRMLANLAVAGSERANQLLIDYYQQDTDRTIPHLRHLAIHQTQDWFETFAEPILNVGGRPGHDLHEVVEAGFAARHYTFLNDMLSGYIEHLDDHPVSERDMLMAYARSIHQHTKRHGYDVESSIDVDLQNELRIRSHIEMLYDEVKDHRLILDDSRVEQSKVSRYMFDTIASLKSDIDKLIDDGDRFRYYAMILEVSQRVQQIVPYFEEHGAAQAEELKAHLIELGPRIEYAGSSPFAHLDEEKLAAFTERLGISW